MKKFGTVLMGVAVSALLTLPALADQVNARIKSVDTTAKTITVTEKHADKTFNTSDTTHFLYTKGGDLADGISNSGLRPGAHVTITYAMDGDKSVASEIKLKGHAPKPEKAAKQK